MRYSKELLNVLSKEELINLVDIMNRSLFLVGETCVEESKYHIDSDEAVDKIRNSLCQLSFLIERELEKRN